MKEHNLSTDDVTSGLHRIGKKEVQMAIASHKPPKDESGERIITRKRMRLLRTKLSERLVLVKNETAMLTTFNEIDMYEVMRLRNLYKIRFEQKHGVKLGFMSFFTLAATRALAAFPQVNTQLEDDEILSFNYTDIGIAVQTPKGLMVPVLRNTHRMNIAEIEAGIATFAQKARDNRIAMEDLQGGTFSITNGGV